MLEKILAAKRAEVARAKSVTTFANLDRLPAPRDFAGAFRKPGTRILAELKKASPSKGLIRADFNPAALARELEAGGAAALSVLTERNFFQGDLAYLREVRAAVSLPLLRKDFIFDPYQMMEARANGADAVLLIAAMLDDAALNCLTACAHDLGLQVLGEAHTAEEVARLAATAVDLMGVNARDLTTFETDLGRVADLLRLVPPDRIAVAESAIRSRADIEALGAQGFLIGEALMRAERPGEKLCELL